MYTTRQAAAAVLAGILALPLIATQGFDATAARTSSPPVGSSVSGPAKVVDGDTIVINGIRIRLEGIDAPEIAQTCGRSLFGSWACGQEAARHLDRLVRDRSVDCLSRGADKYGRMLAVCSTAGLELNAAMVREGMAWAFVKYSTSYVGAEATARNLKLGVWQGKAVPAWQYRSERWTAAEAVARAEAPAGCVIKGNITRKGRIYHMPWSPW